MRSLGRVVLARRGGADARGEDVGTDGRPEVDRRDAGIDRVVQHPLVLGAHDGHQPHLVGAAQVDGALESAVVGLEHEDIDIVGRRLVERRAHRGQPTRRSRDTTEALA